MLNKWQKYSYTAQKHRRHRMLRTVLWFAVAFAVYLFVSGTLVSTIVVQTATMEPSLSPGDRLIVSPLALRRLLPAASLSGGGAPFKRGSLVVVDRVAAETALPLPARLWDQLVRFFTAQRLRYGAADGPYIKRVVALPGDEVSMRNFVLTVKPRGEAYALTEFELARRPYDVAVPQVSPLWDERLPFSGNMEPLVLSEDECFVVSDDRSNTNDSRTWGPVPVRAVVSRPLVRYWPPRRIGRP